jgi:hypothetical protein
MSTACTGGGGGGGVSTIFIHHVHCLHRRGGGGRVSTLFIHHVHCLHRRRGGRRSAHYFATRSLTLDASDARGRHLPAKKGDPESKCCHECGWAIRADAALLRFGMVNHRLFCWCRIMMVAFAWHSGGGGGQGGGSSKPIWT